MSNHDKLSAASGVVTKINYPYLTVRSEGRDVRCSLPTGVTSSRADARENSPIVGDSVEIRRLPDGSGQILQIYPRRNALSRRSAVPMPTAHAHEQFIAANVDLLVPVFAAANPTPRWHLLDRYLALAELVEMPALICLTKSDLAADSAGELNSDLTAALDEYERIGYPIVVTSAETGDGIEDFRRALDGKLSVLLGKSGVGKSSLLNALQPGLGLRVNEINRTTGKGRHTTSQSEMFPLDTGGAIIDTPGVREFGLWDVHAEDLAMLFREMRPYLGQCRFGLDCLHVEEPGCSVRRAVLSGEVSPYRYQSYLKLLGDTA